MFRQDVQQLNIVQCLERCTKINIVPMFRQMYNNQHCSMFKNIYAKINIVHCLERCTKMNMFCYKMFSLKICAKINSVQCLGKSSI